MSAFDPKQTFAAQSTLTTAILLNDTEAAMPWFYFHLYNEANVTDETGKEFTDLAAAQAHAVCMARFEVAEAATRDGRIVLSHRIDVEDENAAVLVTVHFGDAVQVLP
jgi:hypothetical protein